MTSVFGNLDLVKVLQVGFTGFGFLLAYLAFRIISKEQAKALPAQNILTSANWFMAFALAMALLSILATIGTSLAQFQASKEASRTRLEAAVDASPPQPSAPKAATARKLYIVGYVNDISGPLEGVKVSLRPTAQGPAGAANAASAVEIVTDQMGSFQLNDVQFGDPDDHYKMTIEAAHYQPQEFILGPSGSLTMHAFLVKVPGSKAHL